MICDVIIFKGRTPAALAASTYSFSRRLKAMPRTTRATPIQPMNESTMTMPKYR